VIAISIDHEHEKPCSFSCARPLLRAELDGLICSCPRNSKQFTYSLLDELVPRVKALGRCALKDLLMVWPNEALADDPSLF
jgi:hypothetical protein